GCNGKGLNCDRLTTKCSALCPRPCNCGRSAGGFRHEDGGSAWHCGASRDPARANRQVKELDCFDDQNPAPGKRSCLADFLGGTGGIKKRFGLEGGNKNGFFQIPGEKKSIAKEFAQWKARTGRAMPKGRPVEPRPKARPFWHGDDAPPAG